MRVLEPKRAKVLTQPTLGFSDKDKAGTIQPQDDALVVTLRIGGYDVRRVSVDQGSAIEIMYPDLYKELNMKPKDLMAYESPLVSFEGKTVIPKCQIRLPIQTDSEIVEVNFIVVDSYSPYTAIVARPWLHALWAVSSTLHQKVKYQERVKVLWSPYLHRERERERGKWILGLKRVFVHRVLGLYKPLILISAFRV